jgi:hypothetical protein
MSAVKHIVASGECEKYSADSMYSYVYVYRYIYVNIYIALIVLGILLVCDAPMY